MRDTALLSRFELKRQQILEAGCQLFMAQGFAETSMDQVTAKSGVSKATVYNHFSSKEILFEEAVRTHAAEVFAALPELNARDVDPEEMLTQYFYSLLQVLLSEDGACMYFLLMSEGRRFPAKARLIYETGFGRGLKELAAYLMNLDSAGTLQVPDADWAASKLLGLIMPPLPMMCAGFAPLEIPQVEEVGKTVRLFLRGMDATHGLIQTASGQDFQSRG